MDKINTLVFIFYFIRGFTGFLVLLDLSWLKSGFKSKLFHPGVRDCKRIDNQQVLWSSVGGVMGHLVDLCVFLWRVGAAALRLSPGQNKPGEQRGKAGAGVLHRQPRGDGDGELQDSSWKLADFLCISFR